MGSRSSKSGLVSSHHAFADLDESQDQDESLALVASMLADDLKSLEDQEYAVRMQFELTSNARDGDRMLGLEVDEEFEEMDTNEAALLRQQLENTQRRLEEARRGRRRFEDAGLDPIYARETSQDRQFEVSGRGTGDDDDLDILEENGIEDCEEERKRQARANVEAMLGKETADQIYGKEATDIGQATREVRKGKRKAQFDDDELIIVKKAPPPPPPPVLPDCQICFEPCQPVSDPLKMSTRAGTSDQADFGMYLGSRVDNHLACINCLTTYIEKKVSDESIKAFPISCIQCPYEITDEDAGRILGPKMMNNWHWRKLKDSQPPIFCPNQKCSAHVVLDPDMEDESQALCPACQKVICIKCKVMWHTGYTCEQFESVPVGERAPEDFALFALAKDQNWSRCPGCKVMMARTEGCNHMTCSCSVESCYKCGSLWTREREDAYGKCSRNPPCALFGDEESEEEEASDDEAEPPPAPELDEMSDEDDPFPPPPPAQVPRLAAVAAPVPIQPRLPAPIQAAPPQPIIPAQPRQPQPRQPQPPAAVPPQPQPQHRNAPNGREIAPVQPEVAPPPPRVPQIAPILPAQPRAPLHWPQPFAVLQPLVNLVARPFQNQPDPVEERREAFGFLFEPRGSRNAFSQNMRRSKRCGYCAVDCGTTAALFQHLVNLPHSVFFCCTTFFRLEQDMQNHINAIHLLDQGRRWIV